MKPELVISKDGSSSLFIAELDEHYHSVHGALQESRHVFINAGLNHKINRQDKLEILEIGFGTGLNTILTCMESNVNNKKINYTAIEKFPLPESIYVQLNYGTLLSCKEQFRLIHRCDWEKPQQISDYFMLTKHKMNIEDVSSQNSFDIIYFDAFAPSAQPELWTESVFQSMYDALKTDGILVTYCAKGIVKRTMKSVGFTIEALPGPEGKREMTRAFKLDK